MNFDQTRLFYSHQQLQSDPADNEDVENAADIEDEQDENFDMGAVRRHFREFLRNYRLCNHRYVYREKLLKMHNKANNNSDNTKNMMLEIDLAHVGEYDTSMLGLLLHQPATILPHLEHAATDALKTLVYDLRQQQQQNNTDDMMHDETTETEENQPAVANNDDATWLVAGWHIQVLLRGQLQATPLRSIKSEHMNRLLQCPGIVISTSPVKNRAVRVCVRCHRCLDTHHISSNNDNGGGGGGAFGNIMLPATCRGPDPNECGRYPYTVVPDESIFCDQQTLKLQESPERVPTGEMPRNIRLSVERNLVDVAPPGTRVNVLCIPTLYVTGGHGNSRDQTQKAVYLRVVGLSRDNDEHGHAVTFTPAEEQAFAALAAHPDVYEILTRSVAPNISGAYTIDIKKALVCQLLGGSGKKLPDGVRLRGDINVLLLGDPSMAKSQFLKFISKVAPVGIYTSGKGSSAAGLTASVVKDAKGEFYLEGGAMVLADGGIVCIDEFDKMRPTDRVAIHEAMEQGTISVAKAGITTVLNSRSSVLAAANPVFGRYDDFKSASENIDLMTTILSRFDMIFLVRDVREEERDRAICQHVMGVHITSSSRSNDGGLGHHMQRGGGDATNDDGAALSYLTTNALANESNESNNAVDDSPEAIAECAMRVATSGQGELEVPAMKKFVQYCKARCSPRLSEEAGDVLTSSYVKIRDDVRRRAIAASGRNVDDTRAVIPITVRQLEALVRISESLAKMRLDNEVRSEDVTESLRLFQVSTMEANQADQAREAASSTASLAAMAAPNREEMERTEAFLRGRLTTGSLLNKQKLIEEAAGQGFNALLVARALSVMASKGDLLERNQGRLIKRIK